MSADTTTPPLEGERPRRIIKRYSNRKLYDTKDSRYVTLAQIAELVRSGEDVQVIDNASKEDKTEATLALIISEEVKSTPKAVPLNTLRELVHSRSEKLLSQLRGNPLGRLIVGQGSAEGEVVEGEVEVTPPPSQPPAPEPVAPAPPPPPPSTSVAGKNRFQEWVEAPKQTLEEWRAAVDERIRAMLPPFFSDVRGDVERLAQRVEELEKQVKALQSERGAGASGAKKR